MTAVLKLVYHAVFRKHVEDMEVELKDPEANEEKQIDFGTKATLNP